MFDNNFRKTFARIFLNEFPSIFLNLFLCFMLVGIIMYPIYIYINTDKRSYYWRHGDICYYAEWHIWGFRSRYVPCEKIGPTDSIDPRDPNGKNLHLLKDQ